MDVWTRKPPPLPAYRCGDPKIDEEIRVLLTLSSSDELTAARKRFFQQPKPGDGTHLAALLGPEACDYGDHEYDPELAKTLSPKKRELYSDAEDEARQVRVERQGHLSWLLRMLVRHGELEAIARVFSFAGVEDAKKHAASALLRADDARAVRVLAQAVPPERWREEGTQWPLRHAAIAWARVDSKQALERIRPILEQDGAPLALTATVLSALTDNSVEKLDDRWIDVALRVVESGAFLATAAAIKLLSRWKAQRRWLESLLAAANTDRGFDELPTMLAAIGDHRAVPYLRKEFSYRDSGWPEIVAGLERIGDPSALADMKAYRKRHRSKLAKRKRLELLDRAIESLERVARAEGIEVPKVETPTEPLPAEPPPPAGPPPKYRTQPVPKLAKKLRAMLGAADLHAHEEQLIWPAIHVLTRRIKDESKLPVGSTKIGGLPDLPDASSWPKRKGVALSFVAQLRLDEVRKLDPSRSLPKNGLLSFFVDDEHDAHPPKAVVLHIPKLHRLKRVDPPESFQKLRVGLLARRPYCPCRVKLVATLTIPSPSNPHVTENLSESEQEAYAEHVHVVHPEVSQILGFRNHDYDAENPISARLLLRLVSDEQADTSWGDEECLDLFISKKALAAEDFSKVYTYIGD